MLELPEAYRILNVLHRFLSAKASTIRPSSGLQQNKLSCPTRTDSKRQTTNHHTKMITKRSISKPNSIEEFGEIAISKRNNLSVSLARVHYPVLKPPRAPPDHPRPKGPGDPMMGIEPHHNKRCGVAVREPKQHPYHSRHPDRTSKPLISSTTNIHPDRGTIHGHRGSPGRRNRA